MKLILIVALTFLFQSISFAGDREGNGGDPKRVAYAIFFYDKIKKDISLKEILPLPDQLITMNIPSVDNFLKMLTPLKTDSYSQEIFNRSMFEVTSYYRDLHNTEKFRSIDDFKISLSLISATFKTSSGLSEKEIDLLNNSSFDVVDIDLQDINQNLVCSVYSKEFNWVGINRDCAISESKYLLKLLIIHELFRVIERDDDNYFLTWSYLKSGIGI